MSVSLGSAGRSLLGQLLRGIHQARNAKGNRIGVLPQHVLAQVSGLVGAGVWHFGRRCGKGGVTCANRTRWRPFRGAGPRPKTTPAPENTVTCARNHRYLRRKQPPLAPGLSTSCIICHLHRGEWTAARTGRCGQMGANWSVAEKRCSGERYSEKRYSEKRYSGKRNSEREDVSGKLPQEADEGFFDEVAGRREDDADVGVVAAGDAEGDVAGEGADGA